MIDPNDVMKVDNENWEQFKKDAMQDELYYKGEGDLLDTAEGRAKFCRLNETGLFRKPDPAYPDYNIYVYNLKGEGMTVKRRSRVDPKLLEDVEFDAEGNQVSVSYEPA